MVLADQLPDLILMDIALPGMDGLTLTRKLKADEKKALDAGCDGYIIKSIDTRTFPSLVAGLLAKEAKT